MKDLPSSRGPYRVELRCTINFAGPLHVGTGDRLSVTTDSPVVRNHKGEPFLPGASIRGVLRETCARELALLGLDRGCLERLFGCAGRSESSRQGRLTVLDAPLTDSADGITEVRDHVQLDRKTGAAAKGRKFDQEVAYADAATLVLIYEGDGESDGELTLLRAGLSALQAGELAFGGKSGWGLGAVEGVEVQALVVDRCDSEGLARFLRARLGAAPPSLPHPAASISLSAPPPYTGVKGDSILSASPYPRCLLSLGVRIRFDGPMLVGGTYQPAEKDGAFESHTEGRRQSDAVYQATPGGRPFLAGSSLRGALQARARAIAATIVAAPEAVTDALFGSVKEGANGSRAGGRRGLLRVGEGKLEGEPKPIWMDHVAIDRITGFAADGSKFDAFALQSPCFTTKISVRWLPRLDGLDWKAEEAAVALLLFTLRELEEGLLWVGSRTTRGYGCVHEAKVEGGRISEVCPGADGLWRRVGRDLRPGRVADLGRVPTIERCLESWRETLQAAEQAAAGGGR